MNKYFFKNNLPSLVALLVIVVLVVLIVISYQTYQSGSSQAESLNADIRQLSVRKKVIETNKELGGKKINEYNKLLNQLIPESEDFFSIIFSFEQIAQKTGFNISEYTINLLSSTKEKISLNVLGAGDMNSFLEFLKKYNFESGRLITNENINFLPGSGSKSVSLSLNFYNKKVLTGVKSVNSISSADIRLMDQIKSKVNISFITSPNEDDFSYATKDNPF